MPVTLEERVLLSLVRSQVTGESLLLPDDADGVDWAVVMREAVQQAVTLLAFEAVSGISEQLPTDVFEQWMQTAYATLANNAQVMLSQNDLVSLLHKGGFSYIILKGLSAAADYPNPGLRSLGDVDFLIDPAKQQEIEQLLLDNAYTKSPGDHPCHVVFKKPGAHLEMHFEISGIPYGEKGDWVRTVMADALKTPRVLPCDGATFCAPDEVRHGLILLLHMQGHMLGEGLGLRHLCDWGCYVQQTIDKPFWEASLLPFLNKLGLFAYAAAMTKTAALYLGTACPAWASDVSDELCAEIVGDIFASGNFGRKDRVRSRSGMMVSQHGRDGTGHGKVYNLFYTLHKSTAEIYPVVKRVRVLHPVLDAARVVRYLWYVVIGKRPSLSQMAPEAAKRKSLYDKLHIFETEE